MPQSVSGNFCHFGPCGAGFGRRSLVAIFQFPFRWGRDWDREIAAYRVPWLFAVSRANAVGDERQVFFKVFLRPRNADELHDAPTKGEEDARVQERGIRAKISLSACSSL